MNHPKQRQIRLPFSVPRPGTSKPQVRVCGICRSKDSQYTCPRCNIPYCSLACFQSQAHVQCTEPFFKATVLESIAADPKAGLEEKKQMMEMLKRFEDSQAEGEDFMSALNDDDEAEDELEKALAGIDLDEIDTNKLFHLLPQEHRDSFLAALRDPESAEAKALLKSAVEDEDGDEPIPTLLPWWESESPEDVEDAEHIASRPLLLPDSVISGITPPPGVGLKLVYNVISVALAYLHILLSSRLPSLDEEQLSVQKISREEIKADFAEFVPFLFDPKSTYRAESARESWTQVWDKIGASTEGDIQTDSLISLLSILPMLHPPIIADTPPLVLYLLSDMYALFSRPKAGAAVPRKLAFYFVALKQLDRNDWLRIKREVGKEVEKLDSEVGDDEAASEADERPALKILS